MTLQEHTRAGAGDVAPSKAACLRLADLAGQELRLLAVRKWREKPGDAELREGLRALARELRRRGAEAGAGCVEEVSAPDIPLPPWLGPPSW